MAISEDAATDHRFMSVALYLAQRGLGNVWPNPAVGCIIVREGLIVGRGWTQPKGRPHAETEAILRAGATSRGATAYVTLEPCAHMGQTPPCAEAIIRAGIQRVVISLRDPDPRVSGKGIASLESAGISVTEGCKADEAQALNAGFLTRLDQGRPFITLKVATSLDAKIATQTGESQWITGEIARARGHLLRASHDAVMVGIGTAVKDSPTLTCRLPGLYGRRLVRVVMDGKARLLKECPLLNGTRDHPTWIISTAQLGCKSRRKLYQEAGAEVIEVNAEEGHRPDLRAALEALASRGITRVLVESGGKLGTALLRHKLVDQIAWFRAPKLIGDDGISSISTFQINKIAETPEFVYSSVERVGSDLLEVLVPRP